MSDHDVKMLLTANADWLRTRFPPKSKGNLKINRTALMQEIILAELARCRSEGAPDEPVTVRDFWYSHIKSVLMRAEGLDAETKTYNRQVTQLLSAIFSKLVLSGVMSYSQMSIFDESRKVLNQTKFELHPYDDVVIFIEKDTHFNAFKNISKLYNIPLVSGSGFTATAAIEGVVDAIRDIGSGDNMFTILVISDFDSYGFKIAEDFGTRSKKLGLNCRVIRVGVNPDQFEQDNIDYMRYPVKQKTKADKEWAKKHGIEGRYGLELNSLSRPRLREILVDALDIWCPEKVMFDAHRTKTAEGADEEGTEWAADAMLRNRGDPRHIMIDLMEKIVEKVRDSLYEDLEEIEELLIGFAKGLVSSEDYDDRDDPPEGVMIEAAKDNRDWVDYRFRKYDLSKKVENDLVEHHSDEAPEYDTEVYVPLVDPLKRLANTLGVEYENA